MAESHLEEITLGGRHVVLEGLGPAHADGLLAAANADRSSFGYTLVPATVDEMHSYIHAFVAAADVGTDLAFAQRRVTDGALVGCTRFLNLTWWPDRATPAEVEIGGTWLAADAQRSAVNTEAKLLLLTHAFETWQVHRVAICTDARNERSRRAIERLGASFEGVLRRHRRSMGDAVHVGLPRDTAVYSIITEEWPGVRDGLRSRLGAD